MQIKGTSKNSRDTNEHVNVEGERFWSFNPRLKIRTTGTYRMLKVVLLAKGTAIGYPITNGHP